MQRKLTDFRQGFVAQAWFGFDPHVRPPDQAFLGCTGSATSR